jgi:TrmH family RNA methyltransferase
LIESAGNAKIKQVIKWRDHAKERKEDRVLLTEGYKLFEEVPEDLLLEVYLTQTAWNVVTRESGEGSAKLHGKKVTIVSEDVLSKMSDTKTPQGILCVLRQPVWSFASFCTLLALQSPVFVVLEDLQDPGNLGMIFRTAEAAGITGIVLSTGTVDVFNPKVIRATMGSIFRVPFCKMSAPKDFIIKGKEAQIPVYAAHLEGSIPFDQVEYRKGAILLIGNEGKGLTEELAKMADARVKIPMSGKVESLNAAMAAGLFMYETTRHQRISNI